MNGVRFIRQNGGLGRKLEGEDHISGIIVYGENTVSQRLLLSQEDLAINNITVESNPVLFYHVSEFFRIAPGAKLYMQSLTTSDGLYSEVKTMQSFAQNSLRQLAICDYKSSITGLSTRLNKLQEIATELGSRNTPLSILLSMKVQTSDIANIPNLRTLNADRVSVVLAQDVGGLGGFLNTTSPSLSAIGSVLGSTAKAKVHESIAWVEKQNLVSNAYPKSLTGGTDKAMEMDVVGLCDGSNISDYSPAQLDAILNKGYIIAVKHTGITGSYFYDSATATALDSDFAYIENNRSIDKAIREINKVLVPKISAPTYVDASTGMLSPIDIAGLEALCDNVLEQMQRDGELSGFSVNINPNQAILKTSRLEVIVKLVPVGTLREIVVKIGLTTKK